MKIRLNASTFAEFSMAVRKISGAVTVTGDFRRFRFLDRAGNIVARYDAKKRCGVYAVAM